MGQGNKIIVSIKSGNMPITGAQWRRLRQNKNIWFRGTAKSPGRIKKWPAIKWAKENAPEIHEADITQIYEDDVPYTTTPEEIDQKYSPQASDPDAQRGAPAKGEAKPKALDAQFAAAGAGAGSGPEATGAEPKTPAPSHKGDDQLSASELRKKHGIQGSGYSTPAAGGSAPATPPAQPPAAGPAGPEGDEKEGAVEEKPTASAATEAPVNVVAETSAQEKTQAELAKEKAARAKIQSDKYRKIIREARERRPLVSATRDPANAIGEDDEVKPEAVQELERKHEIEEREENEAQAIGADIDVAQRPPPHLPGGEGGGGRPSKGFHKQERAATVKQDRKSEGRDPDWGGKISGPLKKEDLAYQMCHPRMCFRLFQKDNYENLMKLMTFSTKDGRMFPNHDGRMECGDPEQAFAANQQILKNYGRTLQLQSLLYDPTRDPNVDPLMICKEYLELHEATRVALKRYMKTTKGDYWQPDGMELGLKQFNNQDADGMSQGYKRARSSASESAAFIDNNKFAPKLKRTKLQMQRVPQKLETYTYKWM